MTMSHPSKAPASSMVPRAGHRTTRCLARTAGLIAGAAEWHNNADESPIVGDRAATVGQSSDFRWRNSGHDPIPLGLRLRAP